MMGRAVERCGGLLREQRGGAMVAVLILVPVMVLVLVLSYDTADLTHTGNWFQESVNRATKAGAFQITGISYATGTPQIDPPTAEDKFREILAQNMHLNPVTLEPLNDRVKTTPTYALLVFNGPFPQSYTNSEYGIAETINEPTVIAMVKFRFNSLGGTPRMIRRWALAKVVPKH